MRLKKTESHSDTFESFPAMTPSPLMDSVSHPSSESNPRTVRNVLPAVLQSIRL